MTTRLQAADGRRFGAQFALFRYALRPEDAATREDWRSGQIYLAHAAITDIDGQRFRFDEQSARGAAVWPAPSTRHFTPGSGIVRSARRLLRRFCRCNSSVVAAILATTWS